MQHLRVFSLAKLAMPWVLFFAFVLPSAATLWGSSPSHLLTLEVCTAQGVQLVHVDPESGKVPHPAQVVDHCPLCQLPVALSFDPHPEVVLGLNASSVPLLLGQSQRISTRVAWSSQSSRAPPADI
jgi:hypothetical protein